MKESQIIKGTTRVSRVISHALAGIATLFLMNSAANGAEMKNIAIIIGTDLGRNQLDIQKIDALSQATKKEGKVIRTTTTSHIALRMKEILSNNHTRVDVIPASDVHTDCSMYDIVIMGSGIYGRKPHPDVVSFVHANKDMLGKKRVAVFAVCGTAGTENVAKREKARKEYAQIISEGLHPVTTAVFAGVFPDSGKFWNWVGGLALGGVKPGDHRDWDEIKKWTLSLLE